MAILQLFLQTVLKTITQRETDQLREIPIISFQRKEEKTEELTYRKAKNYLGRLPLRKKQK